MRNKYAGRRGDGPPAWRRSSYSRGGANGSGGSNPHYSPDYADISADDLKSLIVAVNRSGDGVLFSTTSDGGAFCITVCIGAERVRVVSHKPGPLTAAIREYVGGSVEVEEQPEWIATWNTVPLPRGPTWLSALKHEDE